MDTARLLAGGFVMAAASWVARGTSNAAAPAVTAKAIMAIFLGFI
jgi:hypothetical protein